MTFHTLLRIAVSLAFATILDLGVMTTVGAAQDSTPVVASTPSLTAAPCAQPQATPAATPTIDKDSIIATVTADEDDEDADASPDPEADPEAESTVISDEAPVCSMEIGMVDIDFNPNEFTIPADQPVELVFVNSGFLTHDFTMEELGIDVDVEGGDTSSIVVNVPAGDYIFFCEQPGHADKGMVGIMHVVEQ